MNALLFKLTNVVVTAAAIAADWHVGFGPINDITCLARKRRRPPTEAALLFLADFRSREGLRWK